MPTEIWTADDLNTLVRADRNGDFIQMANINLHGIVSWEPIGAYWSDEFTGTYDGNGFTISNLNQNLAGQPYEYEWGNGGLFGICEQATIENVHLRNVNIYSPEGGVGALGGYMVDCDVADCSVVGGTVTVADGYAGGMVGFVSGCTVVRCYASVTLTGARDGFGGLIGDVSDFVGDVSISLCYATGNVITDDARNGGLIGSIQSYQNVIVSDCYAMGNVTGYGRVGGFIGYVENSAGTCIIENCYSVGVVTADEDYGGFCGENDSATINDCYYDEETSGQSDVGKGIPTSTADMKDEATFGAWDFATIWRIHQAVNSGYPFFRWVVSALSFHPDPVIVPVGGALGVFGYSDDTTAGSAAYWEVDDGAVAEVTQDEIDGAPPHRLGGVVLRGLSLGSTDLHIITTSDPIKEITVNIEVVEVGYFSQEEFDTIEIVDTDFNVEETILNDEVVDIKIDRELSGEYAVTFSIPYNAQGADELKRGKYLKLEGNYFLIDTIATTRSDDDIPFKTVTGVHEFFDNQHIPTLWNSDVYTGIIGQLRRALYQRGIFNMVVCVMDADDPFYECRRYLAIRPNDSRLETVLKTFETFGGEYRLWRNYIIVYPYQVLPVDADLKLEYSVNNASIERIESDRDIYTRIYAQGGTVGTLSEPVTLEVVVDAPNEIKDAYRWPRNGYIDFGEVTSTADLTYMANQYMDMQERSRVVYDLSVAELKRLSEPPAGDWDIEIGRAVKVKDEELDIDAVRHIISYRYDPINPESVSHVTVGGRMHHLRIFRKEPERRIQFGGQPAEYVIGEAADGDNEPRDALRGIISTSDPVFSRGKENDLWIKYTE